MRHVLIALAVAASVALPGCATLFTGSVDPLRFEANVPGVRLSVDGQYLGELPLNLAMSRNFMGGQQFIARFEKAGYVTQEFRLARQFNMVALLDISSPVTSGGIDVLTGSLMRFSPTDYHVQMLREGQAATSAEFRRATAVYRCALVSFRSIQKDLARGGGTDLDAFAAVVADGDRAGAAAVREASLRSAAALVGAVTAHEFVGRVEGVLASSEELRAYRP